MSNHDALIDSLVASHRPISPGQISKKIGVATITGALAVMALVYAIGLRSDLMLAAHDMIFWVKIAYGVSVFVIALAAVALLARPDNRPPAWLRIAAFPVIVILILAAVDTLRAAPSELSQIWLGETALVCPVLILGLSVPASIVLTLAVRRFAPTHLRATGSLIGLAAGGMATAFYALHCPESGYGFVLVWYSLGIALATALGGIAASRALRW